MEDEEFLDDLKETSKHKVKIYDYSNSMLNQMNN